MGRRNKEYSKTLHQQAYDRLTGMQAFGESKREAKDTETDREKIFSCSTYQAYWKHTKYFLSYIKEKQLIRISGYNLYPSVGSCLELNNSRTTVP